MKPYLVDVPVLLSIFIRHDTLKQVFSVIKKARPSKLYIISDGPRNNNSMDVEKIYKCREIVEDIDWDCNVQKLYFDENQGMYSAVEQGRKFILQFEDRFIYLEDDIVVSKSFFKYCEELLEKYKDDQRISRICGMNHLDIYDLPNSDYFFSKEGSIWGYATWKRVYEEFNDKSYGDDKYIYNNFMNNKDIGFRKKNEFSSHYFNNSFMEHQAGHTFYFSLSNWLNNRVDIIPKYNMVKNIGFSIDSEHATQLKKMPSSLQKLFNRKIYELEFPLNHPKYIQNDIFYYHKVSKITAINNPIKFYLRKIEGLLRRIFYGDTKYLIKKFRKIFTKKN